MVTNSGEKDRIWETGRRYLFLDYFCLLIVILYSVCCSGGMKRDADWMKLSDYRCIFRIQSLRVVKMAIFVTIADEA